MSLLRIYHDKSSITAVGKLMLEGLGDRSVVVALNVKHENLSFLSGTKKDGRKQCMAISCPLASTHEP